MDIVVCPFCHSGFRDTESQCPACGMRFDYKDWPVPEAYSTWGLIPLLTIKWADNVWSPSSSDFMVGRAPGNDGLTLTDQTVSAQHAQIYLDGNIWKIRKTKPEHKLKINGRDMTAPERELFWGDQIALGVSHPLEISIEYQQKKSISPICGTLLSKHIEHLNPSEPLYIGSEDNRCKILIKNASKCNSIIYFQKNSESWWIVDCSTEGGTKINGLPILNEKLYEGDRISIAGVDFVFESNTIQPLSTQKTGLSVNLKNVSATTVKGKILLRNIDLKIKPGEFVGLLGPSGCGKSSLIQRLAGLGHFSEGEVTVNGFPYCQKEKEIRSLTSYVPQDVALHYELTLDEEIKTFCRLHISPSENSREKIENALRLVQLDSEKGKRVGDLSGGQKRRVSIMLELLRNPQLLLLDEPTAGLDPATETDIMEYLRRIANQGKTVICSTHILGNLHLFDKILLLSRGEMVFFGTPNELLSYFRVDSMLELYRQFGSGTQNEQVEMSGRFSAKYKRSPLYERYKPQNGEREKQLPKAKGISSLLQQTSGYLYRQMLDFTSFRHFRGWDFWREFLTSSALIQLFVQPMLVALVLKFACAANFFVGKDYKNIFFFSAVAVFWFGLNSAIRELVKERTPWRCLERLAHVSMASYLGSKVFWSILISLVQVAVFSTVLYAIPYTMKIFQTEEVRLWWELNNEFKYADSPPFAFSWMICLVLFCVCVTGSWMALAISAFFKKENPAVGLLPVVLIPVLFFSDPIMSDGNFGDYPPKPVTHIHSSTEAKDQCRECHRREMNEIKTENGQYNAFALWVQRLMPCHEPQVFMDTFHGRMHEKEKNIIRKMNDDEKKEDVEKEQRLCHAGWRLFRNTAAWMLLSLLLMIYFQYKNEIKWEGR